MAEDLLELSTKCTCLPLPTSTVQNIHTLDRAGMGKVTGNINVPYEGQCTAPLIEKSMHKPTPSVNKTASAEHLKVFSVERLSVSSSAWSIRVIATDEEFDALEGEWNRLTGESACTVFQHFVWLRIWWKHFSDPRRHHLHIVVFSLHGKPVGIAPLYLERKRVLGIFPFRRLAFLGRRSSDYLDLIVQQGLEREVSELFVRYLHSVRRQWSCVLLEEIAEHSPTRRLLETAAGYVHFHTTSRISAYCPKVLLPPCWQTYLRQHTKKTRHEFRRRERFLGNEFGAQFETVTDESSFDQAFEEFIALHQQRWNHRGEPGVFSDPVHAAFHREAARELLRRGLVRLSFLRVNGSRVAGSYGFVHHSIYAVYLLGMGDAGRAERYSPGIILCSYALRQAISEGCRVFDFMRGRERYKYTFLARDYPNWTVALFRHGRPLGFLLQFGCTLAVLSEALKDRMRKELWRFRRVREQHGLLSLPFLLSVLRAGGSLACDGVRKLREPSASRFT